MNRTEISCEKSYFKCVNMNRENSSFYSAKLKFFFPNQSYYSDSNIQI